MRKESIVNLIVEKFGGNRVSFDQIEEEFVCFALGHNLYRCCFDQLHQRLFATRVAGKDLEAWQTDNYSRWVEGILNNLVRNDAGEMVPRC